MRSAFFTPILGPQMPKFDMVIQAILKFDKSAHHHLKIDTQHAIKATRDNCPFLSATNDTTPWRHEH